MNRKYILWGGVLLLILALGVIFPRPITELTDKIIEKFGAIPGPDVYFPVFFHDGLIDGGGVRATSTNDITATLLAADFDKEKMIVFTPNVTGITLTLPASSTMTSFLPNAGENREIILCNGTTTSGASFTLAEGTGINLHQATSSLAIQDGDCAMLNFTKASDKDFELYYNSGY